MDTFGKRFWVGLLSLLILILICACSETETPEITVPHPKNHPGENSVQSSEVLNNEEFKRPQLTFDDLINGFETESPLNESLLTIPADAVEPVHIFEGLG